MRDDMKDLKEFGDLIKEVITTESVEIYLGVVEESDDSSNSGSGSDSD
jgi:hypothetical protein